MQDLSEVNIRQNCPFCAETFEPTHAIVEKTPLFFVALNNYPILEGHILIIPREHTSCIGAYSEKQYSAMLVLYDKYKKLLTDIYGGVSSFEHGIFGQSVFHSHIQLVPVSFSSENIITEGSDYYAPLGNMNNLRNALGSEGGYLYFTNNSGGWLANKNLSSSGFFGRRFANALGCPERGDWRAMNADPNIMQWADTAIQAAFKKITRQLTAEN